jgi:hypothetical protein
MNADVPMRVELTPEEAALADKIDFDLRSPSPGFHERLRTACQHAKPLAKSLLARRAIPDIRWAYFVDPKYNIRGSCSHREVFERNGTRGDAILEQGHFLPYLRYFIFGPDLPGAVIARFRNEVRSDPFRSTRLLTTLASAARRAVREHSLDRHGAAEEFYKLSLELELPEWCARQVRDSVMRMRIR